MTHLHQNHSNIVCAIQAGDALTCVKCRITVLGSNKLFCVGLSFCGVALRASARERRIEWPLWGEWQP
jgi:hypothetical protein